MSALDADAYAKMEQDITDLTAQIERAQRLADMEKSMKAPTAAPILDRPAGAPDMKTGRASDAYREDFVSAIRRGRQINNTLEEFTTGSTGGYLVPEEFERQIISDLADENVIRSVAHVITTQGDHKIPVVSTHSVAAWKGESVAYAESDPAFKQVTLSAHKLTDLVTVSIELLQDSMFDIESYLASEFARAFAVAEETAFCVGSGSSEPTGIFTENGGTVGVTAASATEIDSDELISLVYSLAAPYRKNAKFLMRDSTVAAIRKLKDGQQNYLWQPGYQAGQPDKLLGYDLLTSAYVPAIASGAYVAAFGDFQNYWIADRSGLSIQRLNELYAGSGQVGFIATERVDGKIVLADGIQLLQMA